MNVFQTNCATYGYDYIHNWHPFEEGVSFSIYDLIGQHYYIHIYMLQIMLVGEHNLLLLHST